MPKNADFVTRFWEKVDVREPDAGPIGPVRET